MSGNYIEDYPCESCGGKIRIILGNALVSQKEFCTNCGEKPEHMVMSQ